MRAVARPRPERPSSAASRPHAAGRAAAGLRLQRKAGRPTAAKLAPLRFSPWGPFSQSICFSKQGHC